jgi:ATP-dependent RNA helicase DeaD
MGKKDRIHPRDIVDLIAESTNLTGAKVGDIALYDKFSFVEVPSDYADEIVGKLGRTSIQGTPVSFSIATPVQEGAAKEEGFNRTGGTGGGPGGFGGDRERRPFSGGERREGGFGGGYKGGNRGGSSYGGGERREGGSGYGGGYKGNRDGGDRPSYGNKPSYGGGNREGGSGYGNKPSYGANKGSYGDKPSYGNKPSYGKPSEYETPRTPRAPRNESFDE